MRLTIHEDGFGYDARGYRYWHDGRGRWLRAYLSPNQVSVAQMPAVFAGNHARLTHVAYRYGDDDHVYISEVA